MTKLWSITFAAWSVTVSLGAGELQVEEKETIQKNFILTDAPGIKQVKVDNIDGSVEVTEYNGREVQLVVNKTIRAESKEKLEKARQDVRLDLSQTENQIVAYVDTPWRCRDGGVNYPGWRHYGYLVSFDFQLKVPTGTDLHLRTVNHGEIKISNLSGAFDIKNINGGIEMSDVAGSGRAYAVNGKVKVVFSKNPAADSYFGSLNGDVDLYFRPNLSADLRFKTFNGNVYSDFPVSYLPPGEGSRERRDGKFIYRSDRFSGVRVGKGGAEIKLDAFNGNIRVLERKE
jgi:hypothetical protein